MKNDDIIDKPISKSIGNRLNKAAYPDCCKERNPIRVIGSEKCVI